jgi:hypothetical protein
MMTKKDFQAFAFSVKLIQNDTDRKNRAMAILPILKQSNPRFDTAKFLKACNLTDLIAA